MFVQNIYVHILKGGSGDNSPLKPRNVKKGGFSFFTSNITKRVDSPVMMWIQISTGGVRGHAPQLLFL